MNEGKGRRKRRSAFVAARKQIRRGEAEEGGKERERVDKGAAGNKRLANPSCQFNLASNPGEMLIRASLPFLPSLLAALYPRAPFASLSLARASASASARAGNDTLFSRKDTAAAADDHVEIVCKASCTRRFSFSSPALLPLPSSSPSFSTSPLPNNVPFRPSTLVIYRGYAVESVPTGIKEAGGRKNSRTRANTCNAIVPIRSSHARAARFCSVLLSPGQRRKRSSV